MAEILVTEVTDGRLDGNGVFDKMMKSVNYEFKSPKARRVQRILHQRKVSYS